MRLSDEELDSLLADPESDRAERKETFNGDAPEKVRQAVCAFANDLPAHGRPGVVFVGVRDDGAPTTLPITDELLLNLASIRSDGNVQPIPTMSVEKRILRGAEIAVITVLPADAPPVRYKGRTYIRTGPRRDIASLQDEFSMKGAGIGTSRSIFSRCHSRRLRTSVVACSRQSISPARSRRMFSRPITEVTKNV